MLEKAAIDSWWLQNIGITKHRIHKHDKAQLNKQTNKQTRMNIILKSMNEKKYELRFGY